MTPGFGRRLWIAMLTGVPFAIYKFGFGWYEYSHAHSVLGIFAMTWGIADLLLNLLAVFFPNKLTWCLLANIGQWLDGRTLSNRWEQILLGVDTTISFLIVSIMIWFGRLPLEPVYLAYIWNAAVIANVLAVGLEQIYRAATSLQKPPQTTE